MPAALPPPPPPHSDVGTTQKEHDNVIHDAFAQLESQAVERRESIAQHKQTRMEFRVAAEAISENTPSNTERYPTRDELSAIANLEDSGEDASMASVVMGASDVPDDLKPENRLECGMAALRAQRAQRKAILREHKRTTAGARVAQVRTTCRRAPLLKEDY